MSREEASWTMRIYQTWWGRQILAMLRIRCRKTSINSAVVAIKQGVN